MHNTLLNFQKTVTLDFGNVRRIKYRNQNGVEGITAGFFRYYLVYRAQIGAESRVLML
jgi:hypothetical protein